MTDQERWNLLKKSVTEDFDNGFYYYEYVDYLTNHSDVLIGNGTMLINAIENQVQYDEFVEYMCNKEFAK